MEWIHLDFELSTWRNLFTRLWMNEVFFYFVRLAWWFLSPRVPFGFQDFIIGCFIDHSHLLTQTIPLTFLNLPHLPNLLSPIHWLIIRHQPINLNPFNFPRGPFIPLIFPQALHTPQWYRLHDNCLRIGLLFNSKPRSFIIFLFHYLTKLFLKAEILPWLLINLHFIFIRLAI